MIAKQYIRLFILTLIFACATQVYGQQNNRLRVMSFNIRYDNPNDTPNHWDNRCDSLALFILKENPDILGVQEALHNQMNDLSVRLDGYKYIGVGRLDGKESGEYAAIWYKEDRFQVVEVQYYWLSDTPNLPGSIGWDAACERILSWVKLRDMVAKKDLFVLNTHFDHVGKEARQRSALFCVEKLQSIESNAPAIFMGDLNVAPTDISYKILTDTKNTTNPLKDTRTSAKKKQGNNGTFHNWGKITPQKRERIDYILVNRNLNTLTSKHISTEHRSLYLSDHDAVLADLVY